MSVATLGLLRRLARRRGEPTLEPRPDGDAGRPKAPRLARARARVTAVVRPGQLLRFLLVASLAGPALILGLVAWFTYRQAFVDARHELLWTSDVAREHASKVFDSYTLVADRVEDSLAGLDDAAVRQAEHALHGHLRTVIAGLPQVQSLIVLDRDAHLLVATEIDPVDRSTDFADRDYVKALKGPGVDTFISKVQTSRLTGRTFFGWGRSRRSADGGFDGVIDIAVPPETFSRFYATLVSETGNGVAGRVVTMIRSDGQILVRMPALPGPPPMVDPSNPFFENVRAHPDGGVYTNRSVVDDGAPERLFAFRKVPGQPIYIVAGRSVANIMTEWRRGLVLPFVVGSLGAAALFLLTRAALHGARRERHALAQVEAEMIRRESVEEQLRQAQKMEAIGQLTGGVAHDFNNLLTVIRSSVDLLRRPNLSEERRQRYIEAISDTSTRAAKLTGQLLAFARRQALKPEVVDVAESVRAIGEMVGTLTGALIEIETRIPDHACLVNADPNQLDTSLVNLAVNARDAISGKGTLTIRVGIASSIPSLRAAAAIEGDFVTIAMSDTGCGIAPGDLDRIFEPFFTTKGVGQGTGLGLSQVFGFVKQSGGEIAVASEPGRGTTFTLYLPRAGGTPRATARTEEGEPCVDGYGTCVLVVEDNADVGSFATQTLAELGYRSVLARDAEAALAELAKGAERFDVVFSDVVMPGMNGIDLARDIRRRHPGLPVVLTSGYSDVLAQDGSHGFELLHKPYSIERLSRVLRKAARGP